MEPEQTDLLAARAEAFKMLAEAKVMKEIADTARPSAITVARACGLTYREIGDALGISEGRVRQVEKGSV